MASQANIDGVFFLKRYLTNCIQDPLRAHLIKSPHTQLPDKSIF